jgi:hypothetical protein
MTFKIVVPSSTNAELTTLYLSPCHTLLFTTLRYLLQFGLTTTACSRRQILNLTASVCSVLLLGNAFESASLVEVPLSSENYIVELGKVIVSEEGVQICCLSV